MLKKYSNLKLLSKQYFKQSLLMAVLVHILLFLTIPYSSRAFSDLKPRQDKREIRLAPVLPEPEKEYKKPEILKPSISIDLDGLVSEDATILSDDDFISKIEVSEAPIVEALPVKEFVMYPSKFPVLLRAAAPEYPDVLRKSEIEGKVVVKLFIDENGNVVKYEIMNSPNELFVKSVKEVIMKWKFVPAEQNGRKVPSAIMYPIKFTLK